MEALNLPAAGAAAPRVRASFAMGTAVKRQLRTVTILFYWCPNSPGKSASDSLILSCLPHFPCAWRIRIFFSAATRLYDIHAFIFISEVFEEHHGKVRGRVKHKERQVPPCLPQGWIAMEMAPPGWGSLWKHIAAWYLCSPDMLQLTYHWAGRHPKRLEQA